MSAIRREVIIGDCHVESCNRRVYCKGHCEPHYRRLKRHGDPLGGKTPNGEPGRFLRGIPDTDNCVEWPYLVNSSGYGQVRLKGKMMNAHRAALIMHCGKPPSEGMHAAHAPLICHNRRCVNPRHLRWATPSSNMLDRNIDGTAFFAVGERQGSSKLTEQDVSDIRASRQPQKELAEIYGVSKQQISKIIRRERWAHV
jgi:hypothetical protein